MINSLHKNNLVILADISCKHSLVYVQDLLKNKLQIRAVFALNFRYISVKSPKNYIQILQNLVNGKSIIKQYNKSKLLRLCRKNDIEFLQIQLAGFKDPKLSDHLNKFSDCAFLYTCGGIVPKMLLNRYKFLHIHLGWVPLLRGSDCLFYSIIYLQKITASLIYMSSKIDKGDVISRMQMPLFKFKKSDLRIRFRSPKSKYKYITNNIDPKIRSKFLIEFLKNNKIKDFRNIKSNKQEVGNISNFLWIHPSLYKLCLNIWESNLRSEPLKFDQAIKRMELY